VPNLYFYSFYEQGSDIGRHPTSLTNYHRFAPIPTGAVQDRAAVAGIHSHCGSKLGTNQRPASAKSACGSMIIDVLKRTRSLVALCAFAGSTSIGIGGNLAAPPSHTTVDTGPYPAVRWIKHVAALRWKSGRVI
jgi:hypothetical protein